MRQCDRCFIKEKRYADLGMPKCKKDTNGFHNFVGRQKAYKAWCEYVLGLEQ